MNEIFLSYASSDRPVAKTFAEALESAGWSVWWDREIPLGQNFDHVIEEKLKAAVCVVVLWSAESVQSRWVRAEASTAARRECLIPVLIDDASIPLEFTLIQAADLRNWDGNMAHPEFRRVVEAVEQMLGKPASERAAFQEKAGRTIPVAPPGWWRSPRGLFLLAALLVVLAVLILGKNFLERGRPVDGPSAPSNGSLPPTAISIKIGDKIGGGAPAPGAGTIEKPHGQDAYAFTAARGQRVYFRAVRHSAGMEQIQWRLVDESGAQVFETCLACTEPGVQVLTNGGTYVLTLGSDSVASTGTYELQLFNVPPPNQFPITIGDKVSDQMPGPGAGAIESPGAEDIYTFTAAPRQRVYFRVLEWSTGVDQIRLKLADDSGMELFDTCLACSEPGVQTLVKGGVYTWTLGNKTNPATGTYRIQLLNVPPPHQFSINVGERILAGAPGPGAGVIETPGAEDIYLFSATAGQKVNFRILERDAGMDQNTWRLVNDAGVEIFNACMACTQPAAQTLTRGGAYTLTVGNKNNPSTGNYALEIGAR